jgi:hypothetical protein
MCVCLLLQYLIQICVRGGRRIVEDMCYEIQLPECHTTQQKEPKKNVAVSRIAALAKALI